MKITTDSKEKQEKRSFVTASKTEVLKLLSGTLRTATSSLALASGIMKEVKEYALPWMSE